MSKKTLYKIIPAILAFTAFVIFTPTLFFWGEIIYMNSIQITKFEVNGAVVRMNGAINSKTYDQFVTLHKEHPHITTLYQDNIPGSVDDDTMIKLAYYVRKHKLNTMLGCHSLIHSGGVDLFLAGVERKIECADETITPEIGVHSWGGMGVNASDFPKDSPEHELNRKYIEDMLGDDAFYWFTIYAADAENIHIMSRTEINKYGLVTHWK